MEKGDIEQLAGLARITLTEEEKTSLAKESAEILEFVGKLGELDLDAVEPLASVTGEENVMREDVVIEADDHEVDALTQAFPSKKDGRLAVQKILGDDN